VAEVARKAQAPPLASEALRWLRASGLGPVLPLQPEPLVIPKPVLLVIGLLGGAVAGIGALAAINKLHDALWGDLRR